MDGDCSHQIKRGLPLGRKPITDLDSILKNRNITLPANVHIVKAMVFPVVMYRCHSWTIKKAEHWSIDVFELWCWRRVLRVPWTARRLNQSILKEINHTYSLEGMIPKLNLQYFGHLMTRTNFPDAGKDWGQGDKEVTEDEMVGWHHWLNGHEFEPTPGDSEGQGSLACCTPWGHKELDTIEWTELNWNGIMLGMSYQ